MVKTSLKCHYHVLSLKKYDDAMINNVYGIICRDFCGKCLHQSPAYEF